MNFSIFLKKSRYVETATLFERPTVYETLTKSKPLDDDKIELFVFDDENC